MRFDVLGHDRLSYFVQDAIVSATPVKEVYYLESGWLNSRDDPYYVLGLSAPGINIIIILL